MTYTVKFVAMSEVVTLDKGFAEFQCPLTPQPPEVRDSILVAMVCHSNVNRSMEAHDLAYRSGFQVYSYGAGSRVRLPGLTQDDPKVFEFGTPYHEMFKKLYEENVVNYTKNGMLHMLDRDRKLKFAPQKWQLETKRFDVVVCFEQRVYETVVEDLQKRQIQEGIGSRLSGKRATHVVNLETVDNHKAAKVGSQHAVHLLQLVSRFLASFWKGSDCLNQVVRA